MNNKNVTLKNDDEYIDPHILCPSYPNCDEQWTGCRVICGDDVELFGHKD